MSGGQNLKAKESNSATSATTWEEITRTRSGAKDGLNAAELPFTSVTFTTVTVDTTVGGTAIPATNLTGRRLYFFQNVGNRDITLASGTVVFGIGLVVPKGMSFGPIALGDVLTLKGITANSSTIINLVEFA